MILAPLVLAAAAFAADPAETSGLSQDITVRGKAAVPALAVPPPAPSKPVVDEVLQSLDLGRGAAPDAPRTFRVAPERARLERPFPEAPFLTLSPQNIRARYDAWTFEVRSTDGELAFRSEGLGALRESVEWDGTGPDGRLELVPGRGYRYRFTGRRAGREFEIESEPARIDSFQRRDYAGETRLEAAAAAIFQGGKSSYAAGAGRYLDAMAEALRAGDARADGSYKLELYSKDPSGKLAAARTKALAKTLAAALRAGAERVKIGVLPAERGEALAAFVPPSKGARLGNE